MGRFTSFVGWPEDWVQVPDDVDSPLCDWERTAMKKASLLEFAKRLGYEYF